MDKLNEGGFLIAKIHQVSERIFAKILKKYGIDHINPAQGRILFVLWKNDNISISKLAAMTMLGNSTLTSMLDRLENSGYVKRCFSSTDRRTITIMQTDKNNQLQEIYQQVSKEMLELFYAGFKHQEIDIFEDCLRRILNNLKEAE